MFPLIALIAIGLIGLGAAGLGYAAALYLGLGARHTLREFVAPEHRSAAERPSSRPDPRRYAPQAAGAAAGGLAAVVVFGGAPLLIVVSLLAGVYLLPKVYGALAVEKRQNRFRRLLPEALATLSGALRARSGNLARAVEEAAARTPDPLGGHFREAAKSLSAGEDAVTVFETLHRRLGLAETEIMAAGVRALKTTGGNMAETFDTIAGLARDRDAEKAEAKAGLSEQTLVMSLMALLPAGVMMMIRSTDPFYFAPLLSTLNGQAQVWGLAAVAPAVGVLVARKVLTAGGAGE